LIQDRVVHPSETRCEMTQIVLPGDCNALDTAFGGRVMAWVDICAAVACQRFTRMNVVTAAMDQLVFRAPIRRGHIAVLQAMVNRAWKTSMEVGVRVDEEDPTTGVRTHTSTAYLTFVALDEHRQPCRVPTLQPQTAVEERRWDEATMRQEARLAARRQLLASREAR
jgi:acyl-CoA hydrolase